MNTHDEELRQQLAAQEYLLKQLDRILEAAPDCPEHGPQCISHVIEILSWDTAKQADVAQLETELQEAKDALEKLETDYGEAMRHDWKAQDLELQLSDVTRERDDWRFSSERFQQALGKMVDERDEAREVARKLYAALKAERARWQAGCELYDDLAKDMETALQQLEAQEKQVQHLEENGRELELLRHAIKRLRTEMLQSGLAGHERYDEMVGSPEAVIEVAIEYFYGRRPRITTTNYLPSWYPKWDRDDFSPEEEK